MKDLVLPEIQAYAEDHSTPESAVCRALREETSRTMERPQMVVGSLEAAFLKLMVQLVNAKRVLEIGMFTGYSALSMAEALPHDGRIITCEVDPLAASLARKYFAQSPHGPSIDIRMGPALETMTDLTGPFDLIFIDADKVNYVNYYQRSLELLSPQGVILVDNVLWSGDVLLEPAPDASTEAIQALNRMVVTDETVTAALLTIRDGLLVVKPRLGRRHRL